MCHVALPRQRPYSNITATSEASSAGLTGPANQRSPRQQAVPRQRATKSDVEPASGLTPAQRSIGDRPITARRVSNPRQLSCYSAAIVAKRQNGRGKKTVL